MTQTNLKGKQKKENKRKTLNSYHFLNKKPETRSEMKTLKKPQKKKK